MNESLCIQSSYDLPSNLFASYHRCLTTTGIFPGALKETKVIPLHKQAVKSNLSNWRPTSILLLCSKIIEEIVYRRLHDFLAKKGLLSETQFGLLEVQGSQGRITCCPMLCSTSLI